MSITKKHSLADGGEADRVPRAKKIKVDANGLDEQLRKEKKKKEKKEEKKDRKEKKKKSKDKDRKALPIDLSDEQSASTSTPADSESSAPTKKHKNSKHAKHDKMARGGRTSDSDSSRKPYPYRQTDALTAVPESDIQSFLTTRQITVSANSGTLRPVLQFDHLPLSPLLAQSPFVGFSAPTPIQSASWPFSLSGRDIIGIAETGSGKTLAFSLPCVEALQSLPKPKPVAAKPLPASFKLNNRYHSANVAQALAVIVSPTRELAMQTYASISPLAALVGLSAVCLYGGASRDDQRLLLCRKQGADIIVATPGRLKDFLFDGTVSLSCARFVVLDEADRMLDKGFEEDIKLILGQCPEKGKRQTLMFTATWPTSVRGLAEGFMVDPVKITIGRKTKTADSDLEGGDSGNVELQANSRIAQIVEVVNPRDKEWRLLQLLKEAQLGKGKGDRILVFCLYKKEVVRVENFLQNKGIRVASIHGDLKQEQRTRSLEAFKAGTTTVLVATDVAARGLDIPEVKLVINVTVRNALWDGIFIANVFYRANAKRDQFPLTIEDYVHRIGRTARAGKAGQAITLFTEHDKTHSGSLINILKGANQPVPDELLKFGTTVKKKAHDTYGAFFKDVDMSKKGTKITFD